MFTGLFFSFGLDIALLEIIRTENDPAKRIAFTALLVTSILNVAYHIFGPYMQGNRPRNN